MKPIKQKFLHRPEEGVFGDCHRAAMASILECAIDDVPHFAEDGCDGDTFAQRMLEWCTSEGLGYFRYGITDDPRPYMAQFNPDFYWILGGTSANGVGHSVVCLGGEIVHDPSRDSSGIVAPLKNDDGEEYWGIDLFVHPVAKAHKDKP